MGAQAQCRSSPDRPLTLLRIGKFQRAGQDRSREAWVWRVSDDCRSRLSFRRPRGNACSFPPARGAILRRAHLATITERGVEPQTHLARASSPLPQTNSVQHTYTRDLRRSASIGHPRKCLRASHRSRAPGWRCGGSSLARSGKVALGATGGSCIHRQASTTSGTPPPGARIVRCHSCPPNQSSHRIAPAFAHFLRSKLAHVRPCVSSDRAGIRAQIGLRVSRAAAELASRQAPVTCRSPFLLSTVPFKSRTVYDELMDTDEGRWSVSRRGGKAAHG
jgi:hypothetical protein